MHFLCFLSLLAASASAQYLVESSSFGQNDQISSKNDAVSGWHTLGEGQIPQLLSDKIILTPPYPGNQRGALWAEAMVSQSEWVAELEFRATGPERGGGNLQLWYAKDGRMNIGTSSIYTVGNFDGMVLVIDPYGGKGGGIRGFMNDGTLDYKNYHSVDSLAFGHCDYSYRNLGRPTKLQIKQEGNAFEIIVDNKLCFSTDKVKMPPDYYFGLTAASAETADSFEVYKFNLFTSRSITREEPRRAQPPPVGQPDNRGNAPPPEAQAPPTAPSDAQFNELQNRLQTMAQSIDSLFQEVKQLAEKSEGRHLELSRNVIAADRLSSMDQRLQGIEKTVRDYQGQFSSLQSTLKDSHSSLVEGLPKHMSDSMYSLTLPNCRPLVILRS
ncbi:hypothetical protein HO173_007147 [Letharia columbiana]|uniref:L-type lectin-like domain-containing protein n=1 Tax=Letharia columbiana TaxID=112416 RepID=A0A8H6L3U2_9LECA|nr:uncharacterized protein HO173_007147 [Letharia columbiana]KAF6234522.1 hypothetical protein HO173_007147 [Letharia columbiana]